MKKLFILAAAFVTALAISSCGKSSDDDTIQYADDGETPMPEAVDLGLSVKWASFNLGASNEYDAGDYYAWGETKTKYNYTWGTYLYNNDNPASLPKAKDVARKKLGDGWRMPTKAEIQELVDTVEDDDYQWKAETYKNKEGDEILKGWRVTSRRGSTKGNNIFLPAAGFMHSVLGYYGNTGFYWSSTLDEGTQITAFLLKFSFEEDTIVLANDSTRSYGLSIRPVYVD